MSMPLRTHEAQRFDPHAVRGEFEILSRQVYGKPLIYLDNAASAQKPRAVLVVVEKLDTSPFKRSLHRGKRTGTSPISPLWVAKTGSGPPTSI